MSRSKEGQDLLDLLFSTVYELALEEAKDDSERSKIRRDWRGGQLISWKMVTVEVPISAVPDGSAIRPFQAKLRFGEA